MQAVGAAGRPQRQGSAVGEAFTDDGVEPVVHPVLVFPQQLHHRVVRPAVEPRTNVSSSLLWPSYNHLILVCVTTEKLDTSEQTRIDSRAGN